MKKFVIILVVITEFVFTISAEPELRFGIFPIYNINTLIDIFYPIALEIETETGIKVRIVSAPDAGTFRERLLAGSYDIAWSNNAFYLAASEQKGYRAVISGFPEFRGMVIVRADSGIETLSELTGGNILAIGRHSIAGFLFFRNLMADIDLYSPADYSVSFNIDIESMPFHVLQKKYDAAVFSEDTYFRSEIYKNIRKDLKIIAYSSLIPQFPFILHPDIDSRLESGIQKSILSMNSESEEGLKIRTALNIEGFRAVTDADYENFRLLYDQIINYTEPEELPE